MSFYHVLPSNAAPNTFPDNHASKFSTPLPNPYNLSGRWEVALMNMSYTGCVNTFHHDKVEVTRKSDFKTCILKAQTPISVKLPEKKTIGEMLAYMKKTFRGVVKLDVSQKGVCSWSVQSHNIFLVLSPNLTHSLKMKHDVITPQNDDDVKHWGRINLEDSAPQDAFVTFVPLSQVDATIEIKGKDEVLSCTQLIQRLRERIPHTSIDYLSDMMQGKLHVTDKNHVILFSSPLRMFMGDMLMPSAVHQKPAPFMFQNLRTFNSNESWTVSVYKLDEVKDITKILRQSITLPPMAFQEHEDAVAYINTHIPQVHFSIDGKQHLQFVIEDDSVSITFSDTLRDILAFDQNTYSGAGTYKASGTFSLTRRIHYLYVYSSITDYVRIGDTEAPLLAVIPFSVSSRCHILKEAVFKNQMYIPVRYPNISQIDIEIHDDAGALVPFVTEAVTSLRLHYREI